MNNHRGYFIDLHFLIKAAFVVFTLLPSLTGCSFNKKVQDAGEPFLQGEWQQDSVMGKTQLINYSLSTYKFSCDSFYITIKTTNKVRYGMDSCLNKPDWTEYIKGRYTQYNDTLHFKGFYYNADGTLKRENTCYNSGVYNVLYGFKKITDSVIQLQSNSMVNPINMRLVNRTDCVPKPF